MSRGGLNAGVGTGSDDGLCPLTLELASPLTLLTPCVPGWSGLAGCHSCGGEMKEFEGETGHICQLKLAGAENTFHPWPVAH